MRDSEKTTANDKMRSLAGGGKYRVDRDTEGFPVIPGRLGRIEWHDPEGRELAVYTDRPRLFTRLLDVPGVRRHQTGDQELRALFPAAVLQQVANVIKARRRRSQAAPKNLRNLRPRATSRAENRRSGSGPDRPAILARGACLLAHFKFWIAR